MGACVFCSGRAACNLQAAGWKGQMGTAKGSAWSQAVPVTMGFPTCPSTQQSSQSAAAQAGKTLADL